MTADPDRLTCDHCDRIETAADLTPDWNPDTGCHLSCEARVWAERGPDDDDLAAAGMIGEGGGASGWCLAAWRESDEAHR